MKDDIHISYLKLTEIQEADRQVQSGHYIRHEDMKAWLLSWGADHELSPPKCVCGAEHCKAIR